MREFIAKITEKIDIKMQSLKYKGALHSDIQLVQILSEKTFLLLLKIYTLKSQVLMRVTN